MNLDLCWGCCLLFLPQSWFSGEWDPWSIVSFYRHVPKFHIFWFHWCFFFRMVDCWLIQPLWWLNNPLIWAVLGMVSLAYPSAPMTTLKATANAPENQFCWKTHFISFPPRGFWRCFCSLVLQIEHPIMKDCQILRFYILLSAQPTFQIIPLCFKSSHLVCSRLIFQPRCSIEYLPV